MPASPVVQEIARQLGGQRFKLMTGADFIATDEVTLSVKLPRYTAFQVRYDAGPDTYTVSLKRMRTSKKAKEEGTWGTMDVLKETEGVYGDQLEDLFTRWTGLETRI